MDSNGTGLRERKKQQTREAIEQAAWQLFEAQGYDATTVEEIAAAAEVSPRTFFRYFDSKEAVMLGDWRGDLARIEELILARPPDEPPMHTLREVAVLLAAQSEADDQRHREHRRLVAEASKVGDFEREVILPAMEDTITRAIARRMGVDPVTDPGPAVLTSAALGAALAVKQRWLAQGGVDPARPYEAQMREAFDLLFEASRGER